MKSLKVVKSSNPTEHKEALVCIETRASLCCQRQTRKQAEARPLPGLALTVAVHRLPRLAQLAREP